MIDSKVLVTGESGDPAVVVWGVWIPRRGDNVMFTFDVTANYNAIFSAELYEKNYDEVGDGTSTGAGVGVDGSTARMSFTRVGAKELIRVKLTVDRGEFLPAGEIGMVLFRFLEPVWFETVKV